MAGIGEVHAEIARLVVGHAQRQPLRLRLLPHLLARQRRRCSLLRRHLPLRRPRDAQRRLLGIGEAAQLVLFSATSSVSFSACACCRASSLVSGGVGGGATAALCAATCASGVRAMHSAASSAVAK
eukprot:scaffold82379_cov67-Phaeocystis_antarctica.AAC.7